MKVFVVSKVPWVIPMHQTIELSLREGAKLKDLWPELNINNRESVIAVINRNIVDDETELHHGDKILLLLPVSGG